jgi:hypothetical protein
MLPNRSASSISSVAVLTPTSPSVVLPTTELGRLSVPWQRYALYGAIIVVLLFFSVVRVRLRNVPLERDEGEYAYSGQLILEGIPPYQLAYNMKLPGTYAAYAVIMAAFGETPAAIRLGLLLVNAATSILVFVIAKRLHGPLTGAVAGCTYALLSTRSSVLGFSGHATHFVVLCALAGIWLLLCALERNRNSLFLASGLLFGLSFLMKQHGILLALFAGLYLLWKRRTMPLPDLVARAAIFAAGVALPYLLTCFILYRAGVFREFWFWTVSYGRAYASEMSLHDGWKMIRAVGPWMIRPFLIWEIAAVGLTALIWNRKVRAQAAFSVGLLIFSVLAVIPGYYFRPHYFIVLLPAVALWTGIAVAATQEWLQERSSQRRFAWIPLLVFAAAFTFSVHGQRKYFFLRDPVKFVLDSNGCGDDCEGDLEVGNYLKSNSSPQDQVAVLGSEPAIYFYSHRHSATGYLYMYALTENQKYKQQMQQEMIAEVERTRPAFVVYVDDGYSWWNLGSTKEVAYLKPLQEWVFGNYRMERQVPIKMNAEHEWGDHAAFYIFRRTAP